MEPCEANGLRKLAYTIDEAAAATAFSTQAIRHAVTVGTLATRRIGDEKVIRLQDLEEWLANLPTLTGNAEPKQHATPIFRTPEEIAPEIGVSKTSLRNYCRLSGICTRGSRNKIMIHHDDVPRLVEWIKEHRRAEQEWWAPEVDHFSEGSKSRPQRHPDAFG